MTGRPVACECLLLVAGGKRVPVRKPQHLPAETEPLADLANQRDEQHRSGIERAEERRFRTYESCPYVALTIDSRGAGILESIFRILLLGHEEHSSTVTKLTELEYSRTNHLWFVSLSAMHPWPSCI